MRIFIFFVHYTLLPPIVLLILETIFIFICNRDAFMRNMKNAVQFCNRRDCARLVLQTAFAKRSKLQEFIVVRRY